LSATLDFHSAYEYLRHVGGGGSKHVVSAKFGRGDWGNELRL